MHFLSILTFANPILLLFGALALISSLFGWLFVVLSAFVYWLASYKKSTHAGQLTLGVFLTAFWIAHLISERAPTLALYPCGRTQGATEGMCEVWSTAGFPFPALHYFPAGDVPYTGMWLLFFVNALIFAALSFVLVRFAPKSILEHKWLRIGVLVLGVLLTLAGQATIMLRFD